MPPTRQEPDPVSRALALTACVAGAIVFVVSVAQGPPRSLPDIALGWPVVLYLERAALVALLILGLGGAVHRLMTGARVASTGGGPVPSVDLEDATKPTEVLKEGVDAGIKELNDRLYGVEKAVEGIQAQSSRKPSR